MILNELDYYTEEEVAYIFNKTVATLRSDAARRKGPPRTKMGRTIFYNKESLKKWMGEHEIDFDQLRRSR